MKKLLCGLILLFPMLVYSQSYSDSQSYDEWSREVAELLKSEKKLVDELSAGQRELAGYLSIPENALTIEEKDRMVELGVHNGYLEAELKNIRKKLEQVRQRQPKEKQVQTPKTEQQKNAARQLQKQNRQAEASRREAERQAAAEAQRQKDNAEAKRKARAREEQARKVEFDNNKQSYLRESESYYIGRHTNVEYLSSPQKAAGMMANVNSVSQPKDVNRVPPAQSTDKVYSKRLSSVPGKRKSAGNPEVSASNFNQQTTLEAFDRGLEFRKQVSDQKYSEDWTTEEKRKAVDIWLNAAGGKTASAEPPVNQEYMKESLKSTLQQVARETRNDNRKFVEASKQGNGNEVMSEQYYKLGAGYSQRKDNERHFWSQVKDSTRQSKIIDALVEQCMDDQGTVNPDMLNRVVKSVDFGVELMQNGKRLEGDDDVTKRAKEVLSVFNRMCTNGLCD